ncbi:unnamed protein product [Hydatigera taeniaeformis]|uniref:Homeobox domain-containing protein n=1 Tax=Hydatigena taeniaeformis TaxID=6205 RepID=A0A3P7EME7_HYDTA|nr:unnamed protein product [Hydatigera taeniaeformis]
MEESGFVDYNSQSTQNIYDTALASAPPPPLPSLPSAHPSISEYLPSTFMPTDTSSYLQVRGDESFSAKYTNNGGEFLGDNPLEDQILPSLSEQSYDYGMPSASATQSFHSTAYAMEPAEEHRLGESENHSFRPFIQDSHPTIYTYRSLAQSTPQQNEGFKFDNQIYMTQEFGGADTSDTQTRISDDLQTSNDTQKGRTAPNSQLNPNAVAIMDEWYRAHLDRPYPNKEEKMRMAIAGDITETQVGSWFANRRNRSNNTRPKQNMKRLKVAIWNLCCEYQEMCNGLVNATEMQARIISLIERHTKF